MIGERADDHRSVVARQDMDVVEHQHEGSDAGIESGSDESQRGRRFVPARQNAARRPPADVPAGGAAKEPAACSRSLAET